MKLNLRLSSAAVAVVWVEAIRLGGRGGLVRLLCEIRRGSMSFRADGRLDDDLQHDIPQVHLEV
jgi:hypothetical protein